MHEGKDSQQRISGFFLVGGALFFGSVTCSQDGLTLPVWLTTDPLVSTSQVLGLQVCNTTYDATNQSWCFLHARQAIHLSLVLKG